MEKVQIPQQLALRWKKKARLQSLELEVQRYFQQRHFPESLSKRVVRLALFLTGWVSCNPGRRFEGVVQSNLTCSARDARGSCPSPRGMNSPWRTHFF